MLYVRLRPLLRFFFDYFLWEIKKKEKKFTRKTDFYQLTKRNRWQTLPKSLEHNRHHIPIRIATKLNIMPLEI